MDYDFTPAGFRAWLTSHPADDIAGYTCTDGGCPGRMFWNEYYEYPSDADLNREFCWKREDTPWLEKFAATLDARFGTGTREHGRKLTFIQPVTYGQCLDVLDSISTEVLPGTTDTLDLTAIA